MCCLFMPAQEKVLHKTCNTPDCVWVKEGNVETRDQSLCFCMRGKNKIGKKGRRGKCFQLYCAEGKAPGMKNEQ